MDIHDVHNDVYLGFIVGVQQNTLMSLNTIIFALLQC